jgi:tripartite-type tricarboxylate transporter receptor subunit TctC
LALTLSVTVASAAEYSCPQIRIIAPYPPGGSNDLAARIVAERLEAALKRTVVVESRPGATGNIGTLAAIHAKPDGCTLLVNGSVIATFPMSFARLGYDPLRDLVPIGGIGVSPTMIVTGGASDVTDLAQLVQRSAQRSGGLTFSTAGYGLLQHLAVEEIAQRTGARFVHVAYKGGPQSAADLIAGRLDFGSLSAGSVVQQFESGQLKPIAVIANRRTMLAPDVPAIVEQGFAELDAGVLYLLLAPGGTPNDIVTFLSNELVKIIGDPAVQARLMRGGFEPAPIGSTECARIMRETAATWAPLIARLKIVLE